jgi:hypothetical protein
LPWFFCIPISKKYGNHRETISILKELRKYEIENEIEIDFFKKIPKMLQAEEVNNVI